MCDASIFNVHLCACGPAAKGAGGAEDGQAAVELCVDCWAAAVGGAASWPASPFGRAPNGGALPLCAADFRLRANTPPELMAEVSARLQAALPPSALTAASSSICERPPLPGPMTEKGARAVRKAEPEAFDPALLARAPAAASASAAKAERGAKAERSATAQSYPRLTVEQTETSNDGVPCPELGPGWRRVSKRRPNESIQKHLDHHWISPDGRKFNSRIKVARYLEEEGAELPGESASKAARDPREGARSPPDETWVGCDSCGKWRKLPCAPKPGPWFCSMGPVTEYASCEAPEETWEEDETWVEKDAEPAAAAPAAAAPAAARQPAETLEGSDMRPSLEAPRPKQPKQRGRMRELSAEAKADAIAGIQDCGECKYCLDKPKFGGRNTMKQRCELKQQALQNALGPEDARAASEAPVPRPGCDPAALDLLASAPLVNTALEPIEAGTVAGRVESAPTDSASAPNSVHEGQIQQQQQAQAQQQAQVQQAQQAQAQAALGSVSSPSRGAFPQLTLGGGRASDDVSILAGPVAARSAVEPLVSGLGGADSGDLAEAYRAKADSLMAQLAEEKERAAANGALWKEQLQSMRARGREDKEAARRAHEECSRLRAQLGVGSGSDGEENDEEPLRFGGPRRRRDGEGAMGSPAPSVGFHGAGGAIGASLGKLNLSRGEAMQAGVGKAARATKNALSKVDGRVDRTLDSFTNKLDGIVGRLKGQPPASAADFYD